MPTIKVQPNMYYVLPQWVMDVPIMELKDEEGVPSMVTIPQYYAAMPDTRKVTPMAGSDNHVVCQFEISHARGEFKMAEQLLETLQLVDGGYDYTLEITEQLAYICTYSEYEEICKEWVARQNEGMEDEEFITPITD